MLGAIVSNCPNLFRVDLDGVNILMPSIISALEAVLPSKDALRNDLRRPAIQLLLSILPLPLHFLVNFRNYLNNFDQKAVSVSNFSVFV